MQVGLVVSVNAAELKMIKDKGQDFCTLMIDGNLVVVKGEMLSDGDVQNFTVPNDAAKIFQKNKPMHKSFDLSKVRKS